MYNEQAKQRIRDLRSQGKTYAEIAAIVGCHWNTAYDVVTGARTVHSRAPRTAMTPELRQRILDLRSQGKTIRAISLEIGCSMSAVYGVVHGQMPKARPENAREARWKRIQELRAQGMDYRAMSKEMGIRPESIRAIVVYYTGCGTDRNRKIKSRVVKRPVLSVVGACRICSAEIVISIDNKPSPYEFSLRWLNRYVDCPRCGQCFQADTIVSRQEVESAWWSQLTDDSDSSLVTE